MLAETVYTVAQQLDKVQLDRLRAMLNADAAKEKQEIKPKPKYKSPYMALYLDEQALTEKVIAWFERQQKKITRPNENDNKKNDNKKRV